MRLTPCRRLQRSCLRRRGQRTGKTVDRGTATNRASTSRSAIAVERGMRKVWVLLLALVGMSAVADAARAQCLLAAASTRPIITAHRSGHRARSQPKARRSACRDARTSGSTAACLAAPASRSRAAAFIRCLADCPRISVRLRPPTHRPTAAGASCINRRFAGQRRAGPTSIAPAPPIGGGGARPSSQC